MEEYIYYMCATLPYYKNHNYPGTLLIPNNWCKFKSLSIALKYYFQYQNIIIEDTVQPRLIIEFPIKLIGKIVHISDVKVYDIKEMEKYQCLM